MIHHFFPKLIFCLIPNLLYFRVHFDTDETGDGDADDEKDNRGFCLNYVQQPCTQ